MSLSQEYRPVAEWKHAATTEVNVVIHAVLGVADKTMCGKLDVLDTTGMQNRVVNCADCLLALKRERQRRSAEGTARYQERMRRERQEAEHDAETAQVERQSLAESLADALYNAAYEAGFYGHGQDARGSEEWQAVVDAITGETE